MYNTDIEYIGKKIRDYRKAKNMSMQELGVAIGKSKATIAKYENNDILVDMLTVLEICNVFNVDINDLCERTVKDVENIKTKNPFNCSLLYLYYISKNGLVLSSIEIEEKEYANYVLVRNGFKGDQYTQDYAGVLESSSNTAFFCLTNAVNNPGLDKFQIEIDLHSKRENMYFGMFLGVSDNTHRPTARKCILMPEFIKSKERLSQIFEELKVTEEEAKDIIDTKYWDMKTNKMRDCVIKI